jgi:hypothetical protein
MRFLRLSFSLLLAACTRADVPDAGAAADTVAGAAAGDSSGEGDIGGGVLGCSADARPGITLTATDAYTGAALSGFTVVLRTADEDGDGAAATVNRRRGGATLMAPLDSVTVSARPPLRPPPIIWAGASERAGRYAVRVTKPGYRPWDTTGVVVTGDRCHVQTVRLDVRLQPE